MTKIMVSFPDKLLRWLDKHAAAKGTTRSGMLQELVKKAREEEAEEARVQKAIDEFLALRLPRMQPGDATAAEWIRELRDSR